MKRAFLITVLAMLTLIPASAQRGMRVRQNVPTDSIRLSDPAVLADKKTNMYYMTGTGGMMWRSADLKLWEGPFSVTEFEADSWMGPRPMIWAAELHTTGDGFYYYFATFTNQAVKIDTVRGNVIERRASQVLRADNPMGPYRAFGDATYLPADRPTLDGTFWRDKDQKPYLVFCGEWLQNWNGTIEKIELKSDLSGTVGEPRVLFRASDSPWSRERNDKGEITWNKVTDGPWLFRTGTGRLGMLWTSWVFGDYTQGVAYSESGTLDGPWTQEPEPITPPNFGHSMLFQRFDGQWMMSVHSHAKDSRGRTVRTPHFFEVDLSGDKLVVKKPNASVQTKSWTADNGNGTFTNPLFYDEFSDPDVIRVGDDYYLAGTTMHTVPGLVILHSKDLVNWEFASYCFDRFDFSEDRFALKNHQEIYGQGIWAPAIRYHNGMFYVFSNINGKGLQCYTAKDIHGPWTHHNMQGNIYDLSVLFDDDGKIYAIHKYGEVHCTELKPDMSGPVEGTDRVIIPEGNGVGEGHHMYKIDGMYYLISTDYSPNGRTLCSRSKSIWGPYETRVIEADETYGYHGVGRTTVPRGTKYRIGEDGTKFGVAEASPDATGCDNAHQGGIVQAKDGSWWALLMQDFHSVGRTVCLMPVTWEDGWPMVGLKGNPGRAPRTWFKPGTHPRPLPNGRGIENDSNLPSGGAGGGFAPYDRCDNFNYSKNLKSQTSARPKDACYQRDARNLKPIWQWNHNPEEKLWSLKDGRLRIQSQPSEQLMWARNTLTQRVIGPKSIATVELYTKGMKDGDVCGLGNINLPCSWIGIVKQGNTLTLRCFEQMTNDTITVPVDLVNGKIWLRTIGDYDNNQMQYAYSTDGQNFQTLGRMMPLTYQLITFQGSRHALFAFNTKGKQGGYAEFDNFTVEEPMADRSQNIPYGKTIRIINKATGRPAIALKHGVLYDTHAGDKSELTQFKVIDRGQGLVSLQCADGRYVKVYGDGLPGDVRFTTLVPSGSSAGSTLPFTDDIYSTIFLWQDFLDHDFMLLSLKNHKYLGKSPTTGSPYSWDFPGPDPARCNGAVLCWEEITN